MRILLYSRHRYPARLEAGTGIRCTPEPSGAPDHVLDLLARGCAEQGHEVDYLLPAGIDAPLPDGVRHVTKLHRNVDIFHNVEVAGRPWVTTVHAYRPPSAYYSRHLNGAQPPPTLDDGGPPYGLPPNAICVSESLAESFGGGRFVHNGLDPADYTYSETKDAYLLFMAGMQGRVVRDMYRAKGLELALDLSRELDFELVVAGGTSEPEIGARVAALCRTAGARYVGDVRGRRKAELLANARALLFPTQVNEGFGLVMAEALLSGTPVICSDHGACRELIDPDVGFVCSDTADYAAAVARADSIEPAACRARALERFHYRRMAGRYVREYEWELGR